MAERCNSLNGTYACEREPHTTGDHMSMTKVHNGRNELVEVRMFRWSGPYAPVRGTRRPIDPRTR